MSKILVLNNLSIGYNKTLLANINIEASTGQLIAVVGANGVGKSTLLKTIVGILKPLSGKIIIDNINLSELKINHRSRIIGYSAPQTIFMPNLKVEELVAIGRSPYTSILGILSQKDKKIVYEALDNAGILDISKKNINQISDGQRQRAFIARLIAQQTKILVLDEPTAFLDIEGKIKIVNLFKLIAQKQNKLVIFSTHDLNIAINFCDKIWLLAQKQIISQTPEDHALNNNFSLLFNSDKICFDNFSANFYVNKNETKKIKIVENSSHLRNLWTLNFVKRLGFETTNNCDLVLKINSEKWLINYKNFQYEAHNFEQLQEILNNLDIYPSGL